MIPRSIAFPFARTAASRSGPLLLAGLVLALASSPAQAQRSASTGGAFAFLGSHLTVEVLDDQHAGLLRLVRGPAGRLNVSGRAVRGWPAIGLDGRARDHLVLSAAGARYAEYVVTVPAGVRVVVRLPDRVVPEAFGPPGTAAAFEWRGRRAVEADGGSLDAGMGSARGGSGTGAARAPRAAGGRLLGGDRAPFLVHRDASPARTLSVPAGVPLQSVSVRLEGEEFRVRASRPLALRARGEAATGGLEVPAGGEGLHLVVSVPPGTRDFVVTVQGVPAVTIRGGIAAVHCQPSIHQRLGGAREWMTLTPVDGRLLCQETPALGPRVAESRTDAGRGGSRESNPR